VINLKVGGPTRWGLNALILLGMALALYLGQTIFIPTVIALLLAAMLWPGAVYLHRDGVPLPALAARRRFPWLVLCVGRLRLPWSLACMLVVGLLVALALVVAVGFSVAVPKFLQALPNTPAKEQAVYSRFRERLEHVIPLPLDEHYLPPEASNSQAFQYIKGALDPKQPFIFNALLRVAAYGGSWLWEWILIVFLLLFMLLEGRMLTRRVVEIFGPSPEAQARAVEALEGMAGQVRTYLVWRTIINFGVSLGLGLVYYFLGLSQAWTWALLSSVLWYVPYLGSILAGVPPVLDAFLSCDSAWVPVVVVALYAGVVTAEGYLLVPLVMGRSMEMNATTVLLACLFWELVWGTAGLFLAMPLMAAIKAVCGTVPDLQPWANLMDSRERPAPTAAAARLEDELLGDTQPLTPAEMQALVSPESARTHPLR
jgi:predicted PurR-regulated permease PerM